MKQFKNDKKYLNLTLLLLALSSNRLMDHFPRTENERIVTTIAKITKQKELHNYPE